MKVNYQLIFLANVEKIGKKILKDYTKDKKIYVAEDFDEDASGAKLDVGPLSTAKIANEINDAKTIIWNGLLGKAEDPSESEREELMETFRFYADEDFSDSDIQSIKII